ncbi:MAG TPA: GTP cyclohydrolase II [Streptosporangiaceae bacterium]|nr:GTP cyclohydrolase II [Streptosporangiaceae bacterium]
MTITSNPQPSKPLSLEVLTRVALPTRRHSPGDAGHGHVDAELVAFEPSLGGEHVALLIKNWDKSRTPLVRVHSECLTGDVFGSARCDCGAQLDEAVQLMKWQGGIILYLRQEGRGIGLYNKLKAYRLQDEGLDTYEANRALGLAEDARDYRVAGAMLHALGVRRCRLLTNNPVKCEQLRAGGIDVEQHGTGVHVTKANRRYLEAKAHHGRHLITLPTPATHVGALPEQAVPRHVAAALPEPALPEREDS